MRHVRFAARISLIDFVPFRLVHSSQLCESQRGGRSGLLSVLMSLPVSVDCRSTLNRAQALVTVCPYDVSTRHPGTDITQHISIIITFGLSRLRQLQSVLGVSVVVFCC